MKTGIKFDLIYINQVLEHLENFDEFFENLNYLSKKKQLFIYQYQTQKFSKIQLIKVHFSHWSI